MKIQLYISDQKCLLGMVYY